MRKQKMGLASKIAGLIMAVPGVVFAGDSGANLDKLQKDIIDVYDYITAHSEYSSVHEVKDPFFGTENVGYSERFEGRFILGDDTLFVTAKRSRGEYLNRDDLLITSFGKNRFHFTDNGINSLREWEGDRSTEPPYYPGVRYTHKNMDAANEAYAGLLRRLASHIMPKK
ncbi:MAG TPA: hypothetical protein VJH95_03730 [Candidatus Nanoarchaeia archaeon]|nr:hypothetical protein [Candidatus Nanoarchaeia archaeon]